MAQRFQWLSGFGKTERMRALRGLATAPPHIRPLVQAWHRSNNSEKQRYNTLTKTWKQTRKPWVLIGILGKFAFSADFAIFHRLFMFFQVFSSFV